MAFENNLDLFLEATKKVDPNGTDPSRVLLLNVLEGIPINPQAGEAFKFAGGVSNMLPPSPSAKDIELDVVSAPIYSAKAQTKAVAQKEATEKVAASDLYAPSPALPASPQARASTGSGPTLGSNRGAYSDIQNTLMGQKSQIPLPSLATLLQELIV